MWAAVSLVVSLGWLAGVGFCWPSTAGWGLAGLVGLAAVGAGTGAPPAGMLAAVAVALAGWDLHRFGTRLAEPQPAGERSSLRRLHLWRLAMVIALGLIVGGIGLETQVKLNLGWAIFWGVMLVASLSWAVTMLRRNNEPKR